VAWARPRPEPHESKNLNGRPSGSGEGVASNVLTAGQCALTRCFANNGQPYLKFITPTCTAAWAEQRTTCDTVLPSNAPSVQSG
jgi:hypothetical protein